MKNRKKTIIAVIILVLATVLIVASTYYKRNYTEQTFETLLYNFAKGAGKANYEVVWKATKICILPLLFSFLVLILPTTNLGKKTYCIDVTYKKHIKKIQIYPNKKILRHKICYSLIILFVSIIFALGQIGLHEYIKNQTEKSTIFEDEYIKAKEVKITFPEEKRNLIYIFLESMETTITPRESGGSWDYSIIPELERLAKENINFSNTEKLGGAMSLSGTTWTVAGMVAQTAGVPLKTEINANSYSGYSSFLPGVYSLGDILQKEGYNLKLMMGSDADFGGRRDYFTVHGNYEIFDFNTAVNEGRMKQEDKVWWGYDDDDLFKWSKDEILELAAKEEPFNFIMLTADTHFMDGYLSENVGNEFPTQYENVFAYSSKSVYEFIEWIKKQDFYKDTTIVIVGDHIGMQTEFYEENLDEEYIRTTYNAFINSAIPEANSKNRQFSSLDIFPTVLASIGAEIEGDRLGLGTNLFSGKPTLVERYGHENINSELAKRSVYYNQHLLQDDYLQMIKNNTINESLHE